MGRLIDADRLKYHYCWWEGGSREMTIDEAKKTFDTIIDLQPTVDAEPVVRCKDCRLSTVTELRELYCYRLEDIVDAEDHCSRGERREDDKTD